MVERIFLGKPLRDISLQYNAEKCSLDEFVTEVTGALEGYLDNMKHLARRDHTHFNNTPHYTEEWMEQFLAWFELEQDPDT